jgi:hypothetical protein
MAVRRCFNRKTAPSAEKTCVASSTRFRLRRDRFRSDDLFLSFSYFSLITFLFFAAMLPTDVLMTSSGAEDEQREDRKRGGIF